MSAPMSRRLRIYLIACTAIAYAYLLWHAREPLRLNIGDPWSDANVLSAIKYVKQYGFGETSFADILDVGPLTADSYRYIHYPPFSEIIYGAIGKYLGVSDIGTFRLFGLAFSIAAMWFLFQYLRRMYTERVALIATMLFSTSLLWLMYADSMHQAPVMQATGFLALWGLVRAIETKQKRFYTAAFLGSFGCFFTSYDYWIFLPAAVLVTVYVKSGNPFGRGSRHFVSLCAAGCALGIVAKCATAIGAVGWDEFLADVHLQFFERAAATYDPHFKTGIPTLIRRITMMFTPLAWIPILIYSWRLVRAPSLSAAIKDSPIWMLVTGLLFFNVFSQLAASQVLPSQVLLPFYTVSAALVLDRMLDGTSVRRGLAVAWLVFAPAWGFYFMVTHPRSLLDRGDVAKVNAYFATADKNDFMMSNLISIGHIQAAFERHYWTIPAPRDTSTANAELLSAFEITGTDYVHAAIFTTRDSRFIDKSLWGMAMPRRQWSVTGWPFLFPGKAYRVIGEVDARVKKSLAALEAQRVLRLTNFDLYRLDRATALAIAARNVPAEPTTHIDFSNVASVKHELLGWAPAKVIDGIGAAEITGYQTCIAPTHDPERANACKTLLTNDGTDVKHMAHIARAKLLVRVEKACDLGVTVTLVRPARLSLSMNSFTAMHVIPDRTHTFEVPAVSPGIAEITLENLVPLLATAAVQSIALACR